MSDIDVEIVFALPDRQWLRKISVRCGETVADAVSKSGIREACQDYDLDALKLGIWGHEVARDRVVIEGDRIEIYRPLQLEPREARRQLALSGRTMSGADID